MLSALHNAFELDSGLRRNDDSLRSSINPQVKSEVYDPACTLLLAREKSRKYLTLWLP